MTPIELLRAKGKQNTVKIIKLLVSSWYVHTYGRERKSPFWGIMDWNPGHEKSEKDVQDMKRKGQEVPQVETVSQRRHKDEDKVSEDQ